MTGSILTTIAVNQTNHLCTTITFFSGKFISGVREIDENVFRDIYFYIFVCTLILFFLFLVKSEYLTFLVLVICSWSGDSYSTSWLQMQALQCEYTSIYIPSPPSIGLYFFDHVFVRIFVSKSNCLIVSV